MGWLDDIIDAAGGLTSLFGDAGDSSVGDALLGGTTDGMFFDTQTGNIVDQSFIDNLIQQGGLSLTNGAQDAGSAGDILFSTTNPSNTDVPFMLGVTGIDGQPINPGGVMFNPSTLTPGGQSLGLGSGGTSFSGSNPLRLSAPDLGGAGSPFGSLQLGNFDSGSSGRVSSPSTASMASQGAIDAGPTPTAFSPLTLPVGGVQAAQAGSPQAGLSRLIQDPFHDTREALAQDERRRGLRRLMDATQNGVDDYA